MTSVEVLQASVYGIGVCAEFGGAAFKPLVGGGQLNFKALCVSFVKLSQLKGGRRCKPQVFAFLIF